MREIKTLRDKYKSTKRVYPKVVKECLPAGIVEVGANPTLAGTEADLTSIEIDGTKYKVGGGTNVIANPTLAGTEADLTGLQVGETKYKIPEGSSFEIPYVDVTYSQHQTGTVGDYQLTDEQYNDFLNNEIVRCKVDMGMLGIYDFTYLRQFYTSTDLIFIAYLRYNTIEYANYITIDTTTKILTFSGGVVLKRYIHNINIDVNDLHLNLVIINRDNTQFTYTSINNYLNTNGFSSSANRLTASGGLGRNPVVGLHKGTNIVVDYVSTSGLSTIDITEAGTTITDIVIEL